MLFAHLFYVVARRNANFVEVCSIVDLGLRNRFQIQRVIVPRFAPLLMGAVGTLFCAHGRTMNLSAVVGKCVSINQWRNDLLVVTTNEMRQ